MPAYIVATVVITDPIAFKEYSTGIAGLAEKHNGESIVKGVVKEVLEGDVPDNQRIVITAFPDTKQAKAYLDDPIYVSAKAKRKGAAIVQIRLLET